MATSSIMDYEIHENTIDKSMKNIKKIYKFDDHCDVKQNQTTPKISLKYTNTINDNYEKTDTINKNAKNKNECGIYNQHEIGKKLLDAYRRSRLSDEQNK